MRACGKMGNGSLRTPNPYILRDQLLAKRILDMMELSDEDRKLIERLAPMLEDNLKYKIVRSIIDALEETSYPPEEMIQEDFIRDIEEAENDIKEGKSKRYSCDAFKKQFSAKAD
jgi:hypothetical protein